MKNYKYDLEAMTKKINDKTKIIYIANPDNPMGTYITKEDFDAFYSDVPERTLIILDEAYFEYAKGTNDYPDSMNYRYDNVITLRTFSKAYGLAGLRIGYGFAHERLITIPSVTNFITTVWPSQEKATLITETLLKRGIIVRNLSPFGWDNCIRISIGFEEQNIRLISELESMVNF
jgi:histidinol-phosphate aminotransferase